MLGAGEGLGSLGRGAVCSELSGGGGAEKGRRVRIGESMEIMTNEVRAWPRKGLSQVVRESERAESLKLTGFEYRS